MNEPVRILLLEDGPTEAELGERMLRQAGIKFASLQVKSREALMTARPQKKRRTGSQRVGGS